MTDVNTRFKQVLEVSAHHYMSKLLVKCDLNINLSITSAKCQANITVCLNVPDFEYLWFTVREKSVRFDNQPNGHR